MCAKFNDAIPGYCHVVIQVFEMVFNTCGCY